ncbi:MAG: TolC family protein [Bacteroidales bacterium]|jgi:cobalt-zinc-cadmium efflux system outer membrane protein|nr:TolC family protein [Bacteroidales bacterium]
MKKYHYVVIFCCCWVSFVISSQAQQLQKLTQQEAETLFLKQNLELIAQQYNIDIADAAIVQAKLWENPSLSISQINFWSTSSQREGVDEVIPPLFGDFGKNKEFSIELSQFIQIAGQRRKLMKMEKIGKEMSAEEFGEVLRSLKTELRKNIYDLIYLQEYQKTVSSQKEVLNKLIGSYQTQVVSGNVSKSELLRLQSSLLELENELYEVQIEYNELQKTLKVLLNVQPHVVLEIVSDEKEYKNPADISLQDLFLQAENSRPDLKYSQLKTQYYEKSIIHEKSQRAPNLELSVNYDRYGGVWKNFVGFGLNIDLPLINRNQGNIRIARYNKEQSEYLFQQQQNRVQQEVTQAFNNYGSVYDFFLKINNNSLLAEIDSMLDIYTDNLLKRNISMLEYIDFMESYKNSKQTTLSVKKNIGQQFEELQYVVGTDIN